MKKAPAEIGRCLLFMPNPSKSKGDVRNSAQGERGWSKKSIIKSECLCNDSVKTKKVFEEVNEFLEEACLNGNSL